MRATLCRPLWWETASSFGPWRWWTGTTAADRIAATFSATVPSSEDVGRTEDEIMEETIADIVDARRERRNRET